MYGKNKVGFRALILAFSLLTLVQCRSEHVGGLSEPLNSAEDKWFDMDGLSERCETPPASCPIFDYEKVFVDTCVEKGGRSKTCGCTMRCSIKIEYERTKPKPEASQVVEKSASECSEENRQQISSVSASRRPGSDEDRCIEDYLCQGTTFRCQPEAIPVVAKIRRTAQQGCSREVVGSLCLNGFSESLQCPDNNILQLTKVLGSLSDKAYPARRCIRNVLCFDSENNCAEGQKADALKYKNLVNKDGCEYWLRKLCSLDQ